MFHDLACPLPNSLMVGKRSLMQNMLTARAQFGSKDDAARQKRADRRIAADAVVVASVSIRTPTKPGTEIVCGLKPTFLSTRTLHPGGSHGSLGLGS